MEILNNYSIKSHNTFGIDVKAKKYVSVETVEQLKTVLKEFRENDIFILSGGSNMLLTSDIDALVVHINLKGIEQVDESADHVKLKIASGENWHDLVLYTLQANLGGLENLSLIPGYCGTAPIQNIGAYGVELKDVFIECEALNKESLKIETFSLQDCRFGYRESIFKQGLKNKYVIVSLTLKLSKPGNHNIKIGYGAIKEELEAQNIESPTIKDVSNAVIAIRQRKLPDPNKIGNSGSFFKNPVISLEKFDLLKNTFPEIPSYVIDEKNIKIPAGWLIEKAGFKGKRFGNYGVHKSQALVLVNYSDAKGAEILSLAKLIQTTIKRIFDIDIEMEVNVF